MICINKYQDKFACGKCGACRHNRRAEWSFKLKEEARISKNAWFVTLTYKDECLPWDEETGCITLYRKDLQKFQKRWRQILKRQWFDWYEKGTTYRYYQVGEYGTDNERPHYHIIMFNVPYKALVRSLKNTWGKGHIDVKPITEGRIHYISKYHVNYEKDQDGREGEFASMSNGIGQSYIRRTHKVIENERGTIIGCTEGWNLDERRYYVPDNGHIKRMPRSWVKKIWGNSTGELREEELEHVYNEAFQKAMESQDEEIDRLIKVGYVKDWVEALEEIANRRRAQARQVFKKAQSQKRL